jgi:hypothetical protein
MTKHNNVNDIDAPPDVLKTLRDERNQLRIIVGTYGRHLAVCPAIAGERCNCGWTDVVRRWGVRR